MARFSFSIPADVAAMLDRDAKSKDKSRSSLIAEYVEQYYKGEAQRIERADVVQRIKSEHEKKVRHLISEHDAEVQQIRTECEKQVEQINTDNAASVQQYEGELKELEDVTKRLDSELKEANERNESLTGQLQREKDSKDVVAIGMEHELELAQKDVKNLSDQVVDLKGQIHDLKTDKEQLQKQLELVTLRLPAPREGFWSHVFRRKKKTEEQEPQP